MLPACGGLIREPRDEVGADIGYTGRLQAKDFVDAVALRVAAAHGSTLAIDEGLDTETDTIHALLLRFGENGIGDLSRRCFKGYLSAWSNRKTLPERGADSAKLLRFEQAGSSATEVDRIDHTRQIRLQALGGSRGIGNLLAQLRDIGFDGLRRRNTRREVAEAALRAAERDGHVYA